MSSAHSKHLTSMGSSHCGLITDFELGQTFETPRSTPGPVDLHRARRDESTMEPTENEYLRAGERDLTLLERAKSHALEYVRSANDRPVFPLPSAIAALAELRSRLPSRPTAAHDILDILHRVGSPATVAQTGGRYFGFVNGGIVPAARAVKWLTDVWDQNPAMFVISPVMSVLESVCEEWLVEL